MNSLNNFFFSTSPRTHGKKTVKKKGVEYHQSPGKMRVVEGGEKEGGEGHALLSSSPLLHSSTHVHTLAHVHTCKHKHTHTHAHTHTVITSDKQLAAFCYR